MTTPSVPVAIDHDRLLKIFIDILSVDSYWGNEDRVVAILEPMLEDVGVVCSRDEIGNLIGKWPAKGKQMRPIMLNAHMDTVQPTPDMRPVVKADGVYSDGSSVLGADDKAGVAVIVEAVLAVHDAGLDHGTNRAGLHGRRGRGAVRRRRLRPERYRRARGVCP